MNKKRLLPQLNDKYVAFIKRFIFFEESISVFLLHFLHFSFSDEFLSA